MNFETVLTYVVLVLIVILAAIILNGIESYNKKNESKMSFMEGINLTGLPIVSFKIDDKVYNFLLDTGSDLSVINSTVLNKLTNTLVNKKCSISGMEGNSQEVGFTRIKLSYKNISFEEEFQTVNMDAAFNNIKQNYGVSIIGILGSEFFRRNKYVLDFKDLIAYLK